MYDLRNLNDSILLIFISRDQTFAVNNVFLKCFFTYEWKSMIEAHQFRTVMHKGLGLNVREGY